MPDLTAERLHEIVEPVWKKHPGTRPCYGLLSTPEWLLTYDHGWWWSHVSVNVKPAIAFAAALLCEAGMTRWLAEKHYELRVRGREIQIIRQEDGEPHWFGAFAWTNEKTWIEALAAACMAVPRNEDGGC